MNKTPEQSVVDQLSAAGYSAETIISYLEARVAKEWETSANFAECGPGEKPVFGVCRKIGGTPEIDPATGKPKKKEEKKEKSPMEEKLEKAAKAQGSDPTNNKKVVIDGKAYGWAIQGGKPIMVEWGSVAGEKKVGPKKKKEEKKREKVTKEERTKMEGRIKGLKKALEAQVNEAGRKAIQDQIKELESKLAG